MAEVSAIVLEGADGVQTPAELWDEIQPGHIEAWRQTWLPARALIVERLRQDGLTGADLPQSRNWDWEKKLEGIRGQLLFPTFAVMSANGVQGLIQLDTLESAREPSQAGSALVHVSFLEVAPWNWPTPYQTPRYRGVGMALMTAAVQLSVDQGFKGRLGLHALPQAEGFYREACGMLDLGPDPAYGGLKWFEMTSDVADQVRK